MLFFYFSPNSSLPYYSANINKENMKNAEKTTKD